VWPWRAAEVEREAGVGGDVTGDADAEGGELVLAGVAGVAGGVGPHDDALCGRLQLHGAVKDHGEVLGEELEVRVDERGVGGDLVDEARRVAAGFQLDDGGSGLALVVRTRRSTGLF
jgi:hypothetical protein